MVKGTEIRVKNAKRLSELKAKIEITKRKDYSAGFIDKAYDYARNIAPQRTGHLKAAIQKVTNPGQKMARIRLVQPAGSDRAYHMWMHGIKAPSGKGGKGYDLSNGWNVKYRKPDGTIGTKRAKIVSGIPTFMFKTREYLEAQTKQGMEKQIQQLFK